MNCTVQAFPVRCGDCLFISFTDPDHGEVHKILVDTGYSNTYHRTLKPIVRELNEKGHTVDLIILTHTDGDHIGGTRPLLSDFGVKWFDKAWLNYAPVPYTLKDESGEISIKQAIPIRDHLLKKNKVNEHPIIAGYQQSIGSQWFVNN